MDKVPEAKMNRIDPAEGAWTPKRAQIYRWLLDRGVPSYAELYKGAVFLVHTKPPCYPRFVAHAVRDFINGVPKQIAGLQREVEQYSDLVDKLERAWSGEHLPKSLSIVAPGEDGPVQTLPEFRLSRKTVNVILEIFDTRAKGRQRSKDNPYLFLKSAPRKTENEGSYSSHWSKNGRNYGANSSHSHTKTVTGISLQTGHA